MKRTRRSALRRQGCQIIFFDEKSPTNVRKVAQIRVAQCSKYCSPMQRARVVISVHVLAASESSRVGDVSLSRATQYDDDERPCLFWLRRFMLGVRRRQMALSDGTEQPPGRSSPIRRRRRPRFSDHAAARPGLPSVPLSNARVSIPGGSGRVGRAADE